MWETDRLPANTLRAIDEAIERTKNNSGLILNFALNYGGRRELVLAMQAAAKAGGQAEFDPESIDERWVSDHLQTTGLPDPDLLIRTSGEIRLSNFLLWQLAYAEFWFTDCLWPEFDEPVFFEAIHSFQTRSRRYGGVKAKNPVSASHS